ncbi:MAG: beta-propeller domain-containing protein, partial [Gemmatimonadota bacterium]|nr:beta-propeller domain-containing protein [Gemmatimonadota bacterium]
MSSFNSEDDLASYIRTIQEKQFQARVEYGGSSGSWCAGVVDVTVHESDTAGDATTHAVVVGRVSDRDGSVLEGATVLARARTATAASDDKGFFRLSIPTQGLPEDFAVVIQARMIGFSTLSHRVVLSPGDSVNIDLSLCRSAISMDEMVVSERSTSEAITNNQHAGVDEGGIVKRHGDHLVILRRGRLFTVLVGDDALRPVAEVDAFGPGINPNGAWYDELLVSGDQVVVVGYSYARGGTEVGVFKIDEVGKIEHQATYQLKSNDYYSSRNYASRLVGSQLVFYSPLYLPYDLEDPLAALPAFRSWSPNAPAQPFRRTGNPRRVYGMAVEGQAAMDIALHTVTTCDLSTQPLNCESTVLVGPGGRVSYVSPQAVYVWMTHRTPTGDEPPRSTLARLPLDGSPPSALVVKGSPVDQFSFLESEDGYLNVLVRDVGYGDAMWASEFGSGDPALLRVSIANFGDGSEEALPGSYRALPQPETGVFTNRFVGEYLVYGVGSGRFRPRGDGAT